MGGPAERATRAASLGHRARVTTAERRELTELCRNSDARVRAIALSALVRVGPKRDATTAWRAAAQDPDASVRRRAAELAPALRAEVPARALIALLGDADALVAEASAFALGEHPRAGAQASTALARVAAGHDDPLVREAAVAALGARGDESTLPVVLRACDDKPAVRRRAVLALAAFEGPEVEARLQRALTDRDWQVRQAAEDLLGTQPDDASVSSAGRSEP
jgi:HEAT repeat protein